MTFQQGADFDTVKSSDQCFRVTDFMLNTQKDKIAVHDWDNRRKKTLVAAIFSGNKSKTTSLTDFAEYRLGLRN
ncbi:hypothetical protein LOT_0901 [Lentilactobacillus otakiensis DSM 19908 = JCM 15040]|uniref:Uncharacterized protein n=1 Tax=Lentilactobacillus otakiensis DSM 19908 = JCM 15040 TaxID=1423780 RepID=S4NQR2_9LACO|nr:hypothetical protein LOT_0901 [Lentilactobacillus otakiensis DSM 19908 = JCM 15040]